jgi:hypothetical protein
LFAVSAGAHDPITTRVTWNGEISRIVQARCVTCHTPDGRGPMSLETYEDARPWAKAIKEEVMTRRMPKWHAARGYGDFANDPSLSAFEIALIAAWADGGAPLGVSPAVEHARVKAANPPVERPRTARDIEIPCGEKPLPDGTLLALRPETQKDRPVGMAVRLPNGRREIVGWIRAYDPEFPTTYWLRVPLVLPRGSVLTTVPADGCTVTVTLAARR